MNIIKNLINQGCRN